MAHELMVIADATETEPSQVARDRLRCETRKWMLSNAFGRTLKDAMSSIELRDSTDGEIIRSGETL